MACAYHTITSAWPLVSSVPAATAYASLHVARDNMGALLPVAQLVIVMWKVALQFIGDAASYNKPEKRIMEEMCWVRDLEGRI